MASAVTHLDAGPCPHLYALKKEPKFLRTVVFLYRYLIAPRHVEGKISIEQENGPLLCAVCDLYVANAHRRVHVCMSCAFAGCYPRRHIARHANEAQHWIALDTVHGALLCVACDDYIYDNSFEELALKEGASLFNRRWHPTSSEIGAMTHFRKRRKVSGTTVMGLRGMVNLGNTCFMNCVIQTMCHTPILRDALLTDFHVCPYKTSDPAGGGGQGSCNSCIVCEMKSTFQEMYSGKTRSFVPYRLLYLIWQNSKQLAGYEQQDAHEFLIATLDLLHQHSKEGQASRTSGDVVGPLSCHCIIDRIFTGCLQSDVVCQSCFNVSTTIDPFWDISLDIALDEHTTPGSDRKTAGGAVSARDSNVMLSSSSRLGPSPSPSGGQAVSGGAGLPHMFCPRQSTLMACLKRFTKPEHLGSAAKINCTNCASPQLSTKQLSIKNLPFVICFHLKRFEHSIRLHRKISSFVQFPESLDMTPFTIESRDDDETSSRNYLTRLYKLFAVVVHVGTIQSGHYTVYIRQSSDCWFRCNDHSIYPASIGDVLSSEGYLLFYHKACLDYTAAH